MEDQIWNNIIKRITNVETAESKLQLNQWLNASEQNQKLYQEAVQLWQWTGLLPKVPKQKDETVLVKPAVEDQKRKAFSGILKYGIAASVALVCSLAVYYVSKSTSEVSTKDIVYTVHKALNGKVMKVTLPDSSTIWLNAGSEVSYPKDFRKHKTRIIQLIGEAFFEVTHNEKQPFVVESGKLKTIVYGTSFNVSSYKDSEQSSVAVKTGKVGVLLREDSLGKSTMLLPGNRLVYHRDNRKLETSSVYTDEVANWINGDLLFDQATPEEVFAALERKFDVAFNFNAAELGGCKITAKFPNQSLKTILIALSASLHIKVKEYGKTFEIIGGQRCNK